MKRCELTAVALAVASLACAVTLNVANADLSGGAATEAGRQQPVRLAQATATQPLPAKKTKRPKVEHPKTNWLNPQPEPPMGSKKPVKGNNWLNPQPEPPRPDTTKKLQ